MRTKEITNFILGEFDKIGNEDALSHYALITDVLTRFPALPSRIYAANRINQVLRNKEVTSKFKKFKGNDKKQYIIRNQQIIEENIDVHTTTDSHDVY
jgi:hypothetical protein